MERRKGGYEFQPSVMNEKYLAIWQEARSGEEKGRHTNQDAEPEADDLMPGQIEKEFRFDL